MLFTLIVMLLISLVEVNNLIGEGSNPPPPVILNASKDKFRVNGIPHFLKEEP